MNMKQIILSLTFFLALAIGAQAQIIKGAGILYFDSLVNVNANTAGAELAWSIKLKKGYRWDRTLSQWIEHPTFSAIDSTLANNGLTLSGDTVQLGGTLTKNTEVDINGKTLRFRDAAGYPDFFMNGTYGLLGSDANTYLDVGSTAGRARIVAATTAQLTSAANTDVSATDTVTITGQRIRLSAADTRIQQVSKNNALNRVMMIDSITEQIYYRDVSSIAGGGGGGSGTVTSITAGVGLTGGTITTSGTIAADTSGMLVSKSFLTNQGYTTNTGTVTGTGTTGTIPVWSSSSALVDSPLTVASGNVSVSGTGAFRLGNWTTAGRPGTPTSGMKGYNTTLGYPETYGASAWLQSAFPVGATGQTLRNNGSTGWVSSSFLANTGTAINVNSPTVSDGVLNLNVTNAWAAIQVSGNSRYRIGGLSGVSDWAGQLMNIKYAGGVWTLDDTTKNAAFFKLDTRSVSTGNEIAFYRVPSGANPKYDADVSPMLRLKLATSDIYLSEITGSVHIGGSSPARKLHVTGEARITGSAGTGTSVMLRDANGDISNATLGPGLSLTSGTLASTITDTHIGNTNLSLTGARTVTLGSNTLTISGTSSAPSAVNFSMAPSTNTTTFQSLDGSLNNSTMTITPTRTQIVTTNVTGGTAATYGFFADSVRISPGAVPNDDAQTRMLAINATTGRLHYVTKSTINAPSYNFAELTVSGGSTSATAGTPERPDNDTPGRATSTIVGTFTASGSTLDYTGAAGQGKVSAVISLTTSGGGEVLISIYKEGTEIASTEMREAVNAIYTTVALPTITTALATNDTFEIRIEPVTGSNTITVHRSTLLIEKLY